MPSSEKRKDVSHRSAFAPKKDSTDYLRRQATKENVRFSQHSEKIDDGLKNRMYYLSYEQVQQSRFSSNDTAEAKKEVEKYGGRRREEVE